ncbi:DUF4249 domain-containing protein [Pontibacter actiniarum]|uniref:DUF4249 domain-containing protein n=1 Tax=Pontibacter actiniarum TaxID=323450 RepID=UPI00040DCF1A|nr:DUF4249 domain-containing protein [Pontibacter actiniarum]
MTSAEGERYRFANDGDDGNYFPVQPLEAAGVVGHTYTLHIEVGGRVYKSNPVTLKGPVPIDSIHAEVDEQVFSFPRYKERKVLPGYKVLVDYQDPADVKNFLRWTFESIYEVETEPRDFVDSLGRPAPKNCCTRCIISERPDRFKVLSDRLANGQKRGNQEILFIPFERYITKKYKLRVYQHAITEQAYEFFRIMEQQKETTGTVFDPPPAELKGNMFNVNDEDEQVIGFFDVSAVSVEEIVFLLEDIAYPVPDFIYPDDCCTLPGASAEIPEDW